MTVAPKIADVMTKIVELLTPLESGDRGRVVKAAFTLLGESQVDLAGKDDQAGAGAGGDGALGLPARAVTWMRQQGLTAAQIQEVFHVEKGQVEVIASEIPGKGKKGQTVNSYILQGLKELLASGEPAFNDKAARQLCNNLGCYDKANHAINMKEGGGNLWIGSKEKGWRLTTPGLKHGAELVKQMTAAAA